MGGRSRCITRMVGVMRSLHITLLVIISNSLLSDILYSQPLTATFEKIKGKYLGIVLDPKQPFLPFIMRLEIQLKPSAGIVIFREHNNSGTMQIIRYRPIDFTVYRGFMDFDYVMLIKDNDSLLALFTTMGHGDHNLSMRGLFQFDKSDSTSANVSITGIMEWGYNWHRRSSPAYFRKVD